MPLRRWDAFHQAHDRVFVVFADLVGGRSQARFELLMRLAHALQLSGNYALSPGKAVIRIVLALEGDARKFADALQARETARESGWAGQWVSRVDADIEAAIAACMPPTARRSSGKRPGVKFRRRGFPM